MVTNWGGQPAAMAWGDGYDWLRRQRATPPPASNADAWSQYGVPDAPSDPWGQAPGGGFSWAKQSQGTADPLAPFGQAAVDAAKQGVQTVGAAAQQQAAASGKNGQTYGTNSAKTGTAGRTGATYAQFLQQHPDFDPWSNLDTYAGPNAGNDPILAQAFGWTNQWARDNDYGDGSKIPLAQRQQVFLANLERARQQWADYTVDGQSHPGAITWEQSQASRIPNQGWYYEAGSGLRGNPVTTPPTTTNGQGNGQNNTNGQGTGGNKEEPVADPMGSGLVTGAVTASNASQPPTNTGAGTGANGSYDLQLQTDKARRMAALFQALGLGSGAQQRSWAGSNLMNIAQSLFDPWSQTQGLDDSSPTTMDMIAKFARYLGAGGGGAGSIRGDAASAIDRLAGGAGALQGLGDRELLPLLQTMSGLAHTGQNKILQTGYGNLADEATGQYMNQLNATDAAGGNSADLSVLQFLKDNPTYRFLVGR